MHEKNSTLEFHDAVWLTLLQVIFVLTSLQRDSTIAKLLFGMVFKAIFEKMGDVKTERELEETVDQINSSMDNILSTSTQYYSPFIGCILVGLRFMQSICTYIFSLVS